METTAVDDIFPPELRNSDLHDLQLPHNAMDTRFVRQPGGRLKRYHCESKVIMGPRECNHQGIIPQSRRHLPGFDMSASLNMRRLVRSAGIALQFGSWPAFD